MSWTRLQLIDVFLVKKTKQQQPQIAVIYVQQKPV